MKEPRKQSLEATPHTPQAILIPDQGTTPINLRMDKRTHGAVLLCAVEFDMESAPCRALRVAARALGNQADSNGAIGLESNEDMTEPMVVSNVSKTVAQAGWNRAPAKTF
jgi:hypothetical protein